MTRINLDRSSLTPLLGPIVLLTCACASAPPPTSAVDEQVEVAVATETVAEAASNGEDEEQEHSNTLRWTTASEVDNFGFDVYRGDQEEGPFERLTESPLAGAGTTDLTTRYSHEDTNIDPYRTYYYYVESISLQGIREQFTPIIRAKPKLPADAEAEAEGEIEAGDS